MEEMTWYFNESKFPICASFLDEFDCEREQCKFSHDEPIYLAKVTLSEEVRQSMDQLIEYLKDIGQNHSLPISEIS